MNPDYPCRGQSIFRKQFQRRGRTNICQSGRPYAGDEDEPEGVSDGGLALGVPAAVGDVLAHEHVVAQAQEELGEPRDDGRQRQHEAHHVHADQAWKRDRAQLILEEEEKRDSHCLGPVEVHKA